MITRNLLQYLENSADSFPDKISFTDENTALTFSQLREKAKKIGSYIASSDIAPASPIAVLTGKNTVSLCAMFGSLYAGCFYAPLDSAMPLERLKIIINNLKPALLICESPDEVSGHIPCKTASFEEALSAEIAEKELKERVNNTLDIDPAYVIYTSGSTGTPKGIAVSHRSVVDFTEWLSDTCGFCSDDVMGNQAPFYFDASVKDIYITLKNSATAHIIPKKCFMFPKLLFDFLNEKKVTSLIWATSAFHLVANLGILEKEKIHSLKRVVLGGEALLAKQYNRWKRSMPDVEYYNLYGPTEVTVDCTYFKIEEEFSDHDSIPIGKACENKQCFILDENLRPVKQGETGEICVRGTGVALGYYNDSEKTALAFVKNPFTSAYDDRIYRTGDLGYLREDGNIMYVSRADGQIKHNGYRIELGEIERAVSSMKEINACVCLFDKPKDKILCVYEGNCSDSQIITHIDSIIPKYMFPNKFIRLEKMPYNANGKIDRKLLKDSYL